MKNEENLQEFNDEMPGSPVLPPVRVEIGNLANMVNNLSTRIYNIEQASFRIGQRLDTIEQAETSQSTGKRTKKETQQPAQPVPAWQQKPAIAEEPIKKKSGTNPTRMIIFIIIAVAIVFVLGNCQSIMSYIQPAAGG